MNITRKRLNDYQKIKRDIGMLEMEIKDIDAVRSGAESSGSLGLRPSDGLDNTTYRNRLKSLEQKRNEVNSIERWIDEIEDPEARCISRMFYIEGISWVNIAKKIGYGVNVDYPRKMIRDKYLKQYKIM